MTSVLLLFRFSNYYHYYYSTLLNTATCELAKIFNFVLLTILCLMCNQGRTKSSKLKSVYSYLKDFPRSILLFLKSSVDRCPYLHVCVYWLYSRSVFSFSF